MPKSEEQCKKIRQKTRTKILNDSILYFAKNGFSGTKISDLAKHIGIAQGTMYIYFKSKEELFNEIYMISNNSKDFKDLRVLSNLPISSKKKIQLLSEDIINKLNKDNTFSSSIALSTQMMFEKEKYSSIDTTYQSELYHITMKIVQQGQKEGSIVQGTPMKLVDYYWGVVYLYALKKLFTSEYESISSEDLARILIKD